MGSNMGSRLHHHSYYSTTCQWHQTQHRVNYMKPKEVTSCTLAAWMLAWCTLVPDSRFKESSALPNKKKMGEITQISDKAKHTPAERRIRSRTQIELLKHHQRITRRRMDAGWTSQPDLASSRSGVKEDKWISQKKKERRKILRWQEP